MEINDDFVSLSELKDQENDLFILLDAGITKKISLYTITSSSQLIALSAYHLQTIKSAHPQKANILLSTSSTTKINEITGRAYSNTTNQTAQVSIFDIWVKKIDIEKSLTKIKFKSFSFETEKKSLLKMVLGMARACYNYDPDSSKNSATGSGPNSIKKDMEMFGLYIDEKTVRDYLKAAVAEFSTQDPRKHPEKV